jgi:HlyD family secretion protein
MMPASPSTPASPQPLGFPAQFKAGRPDVPVVRPTPLPKRPKGRWFIGVILFGLSAFFGHSVWESFFRYRAYGTVDGRSIEVSPPWDGSVQYLHVREGDVVRQGQLLMTLENLEMRQRLLQLGDELRVAQATLESESAKLKWQFAYNMDQSQGAVATYYETLGNLLREQARLEDLKINLKRAESLSPLKAISREEYDQIRYAKEGQELRVAKLQEALGELKRRADQADALMKRKGTLGGGMADNGADQLKPNLVRIEAFQAERRRLQERLDQGLIRAPCNGLVLKVRRFAGERCKVAEPLLTVLEEGSVRIILYLPQDASALLAPGAEVPLTVEPYPELLACAVVRLGDQFEPAPENIKRHYREGQKLLPVILRPKEEWTRWMALRVGGVVKLSYHWPLP